jgi:CheY-like chemotaxis protein
MPRSADELSPATRRAYASDIRDIEEWCVERAIEGGVANIDERRIFAYLVELVRVGRSVATVRRRLTALRSFPLVSGVDRSSVKPRLTDMQLFEVERRVLTGKDSRTGVLVICDDPIVRAGLRAVLSDAGVLCWSDPFGRLDEATITVWDYVIIWGATPKGIDTYWAIRELHSLNREITSRVPVVAVFDSKLSLVARLRFAEAGVRYAIPHAWLATNIDHLSVLLATAEIPQRFHLETPLALRQELGFNLSGDLAALLAAAAGVPADVWVGDLPQRELQTTRNAIQNLRRIALKEAGVPAPPFSKYATSMRTPPSTPEWVTVRKIVSDARDA